MAEGLHFTMKQRILQLRGERSVPATSPKKKKRLSARKEKRLQELATVKETTVFKQGKQQKRRGGRQQLGTGEKPPGTHRQGREGVPLPEGTRKWWGGAVCLVRDPPPLPPRRHPIERSHKGLLDLWGGKPSESHNC